MTWNELESYLLLKKEAVKEFPFGPETAVYKVRNKMFALMGEMQGELKVNLKCDPIEAGILRSNFEGIIPGYHMNKRLWNSVFLDKDVPDDLLKEMVDVSYELVVMGMTKKDQKDLLS